MKWQKNLDTISIDLKKVHRESENLEQRTTKSSGDKYLIATNVILEKSLGK